MENNIIENFIYDDEIEIYSNYSGYCLTKRKSRKGNNVYSVYDEEDYFIGEFVDSLDVKNLVAFETTSVYKKFRDIVLADIQEKKEEWSNPSDPNYGDTGGYGDAQNFDGYDEEDSFPGWWLGRSRTYPSYSSYHYSEPKKSTGFLDKLNKSDTLVVHCKDSTTEMLCQVYEGKGWDVLRDGNIDKKELHELIKNHKRIVCLGHGTPSGLINKQGWGSVIGDEEAPLLKDKKLFIIWCNADAYFKRHGIGKGYLITGNLPSDSGEARCVGYNVPRDWMDENITYWSKLMADVVERALEGDAKGAVEYVRKEYAKKYIEGETDKDKIGITQYNIDRTKVQD